MRIMLSKSALEGLYPHKQLILRRDLIFRLDLVIEVDPCYSAIGVHLHFLALHEPAAKGLLAVVIQIEHYLVPAVVQFQRHGAFEGLDACDGLIIAGDEGALDVLIVQDGHLEPEVLVQLHWARRTFLTSRTRMGNLRRIEVLACAGKAM